MCLCMKRDQHTKKSRCKVAIDKSIEIFQLKWGWSEEMDVQLG